MEAEDAEGAASWESDPRPHAGRLREAELRVQGHAPAISASCHLGILNFPTRGQALAFHAGAHRGTEAPSLIRGEGSSSLGGGPGSPTSAVWVLWLRTSAPLPSPDGCPARFLFLKSLKWALVSNARAHFPRLAV